MSLAVLILVFVVFLAQCLIYFNMITGSRFKKAEDMITSIADDIAGATRNSAECYNVIKQISNDIKSDTAELENKVKSMCKSVDSSGTTLEKKLVSAVKVACEGISSNLKAPEEELNKKILEMQSAVNALIDSVVITRNSDGIIPTELLKYLVEATEKEDQTQFAETIGKAKAFLELYGPVENKIVREKAVKKVVKRNYGFF